MLIDITWKLTAEKMEEAQRMENKALEGHWGTHFDVMDKEFPLEYTRRQGIVFDVSAVEGRDVCCGDIALEEVQPGMFVAFCTGFIEAVGYGEGVYFKEHPQLSHELIDALLDRGVSIIGVDFAGIRRGAEHTPKDQYCADRGTFVIENLRGLKALVDGGGRFEANTYPMLWEGVTGLPCRVIARL